MEGFGGDEERLSLEPKVAKELFEAGSIFIINNARMGMEIGIDCKSWSVGPKFQGIKLIPPGFHFLYWSSLSLETGDQGSRNGLFLFSQPRQVLVFDFNHETEQLELCQPTASNVNYNLYELDRFMGPYPLKLYGSWKFLSNFIGKDCVARVLSGDDSSGWLLDSMMGSRHSKIPEFSSEYLKAHIGDMADESMQRQQASEGNPSINFTEIDLKLPKGCLQSQPESITRFGVDKSSTLRDLVGQELGEAGFLGEFQLSYLFLLFGFNYDGFDQWKLLLTLVCASPEYLITENPEFFCKFTECLYHQMIASDSNASLLDLLGEDFGNASFLMKNFELLHGYWKDEVCNSQNLNEKSKRRLDKRLSSLFQVLEKCFKRTFETEIPEDELPIVVDTLDDLDV